MDRVQYFQQILKGVHELSLPHPQGIVVRLSFSPWKLCTPSLGGSLAPPPNLGQWEKVVCFALQIGVSYSLFPSSFEYAQICQNPVEDCGSERRPCYVSLIKLRKGKCTFYCQSSCICSRGCITILKQPWGGEILFLRESDNLFWGNRSGNGECWFN